MKVVNRVTELRQQVQLWRDAHESVAFVPTMGSLHAGHVELMDRASGLADHVIASIFVNPLQFGEGEDLAAYPRTYDADCEKLSQAGVELLFFPSVEEMYPVPPSQQTKVVVPGLSDLHCGESRPGHFSGVATVVTKFFNMVQPDYAVFGTKDFQQLMVISRLVEDLSLPLKVVGLETVREPDGLALSSRNGYLTEEERMIAPGLYKTLQWMRQQLEQGRRDYSAIEEDASLQLKSLEFKKDYLNIASQLDLMPPGDRTDKLVILAAVYLGNARLIDNISIDL